MGGETVGVIVLADFADADRVVDLLIDGVEDRVEVGVEVPVAISITVDDEDAVADDVAVE